MNLLKKFYPHALAVLGFVLVSIVYFYPVLQGKKIFQSDIAQYTGMAKEQNDFRANENAEPYWTNSAFGGMPTYQLGAKYPNDFIGDLDDVIRFLPRPADYLFLYFLGFYVLLLVLKIDPLKAFFGALAFGLSTYLIIILGVGHNAKAHAIAYMPFVIAGTILVYKKKYIVGGLLAMFATALEINANHFQMTYYFLFLLLIIGIYYSIKLLKSKDYKALVKIKLTFLVAIILALGANATNLLATKEYADFSTRGKNELTYNPDGSKVEGTNGLSHEYITEYSYGVSESLNIFAARLFGGSNSENLGTQSKMYEFMVGQGVPEGQAAEFASGLPTYWGDQPIVAAPAYIGAVVFFLAILALFVDKRKLKYVFLSGAILSLVLSWGKNFSIITDLLIDYMPLYNKFRAVSSIQVVLELCMPILAIMGLQAFFKAEKEFQFKALWQSAAVVLGLIVALFLFKGMFSFSGGSDGYYLQSYGPEFVDALKEDRKSMYSADLLRSGFLIVLTAALLWMANKNKLNQQKTVILVGLVMVLDLFFMAKNYVGKDDFVPASQVDVPFAATPADMQILQDTTHYRVLEIDGNMSSARASYFHKSIGGYSAVKPQRMQQLFDYQIARNNIDVLNMLNVKYLIQTDSTGNYFPTLNPEANGNAWFVKNLKKVNSADAEMKALDSLDTKNICLLNQVEFGAWRKGNTNNNFEKDSTATIRLLKYKPNHLVYESNNTKDGFGVFSEMYYKNGWKATIKGKELPIYRVDYVLRGLEIPAGKHTIEFKFEPEVVKTGSTIALYSFIGMVLILIAGIYFEYKNNQNS
jgi:hypothetical protein